VNGEFLTLFSGTYRRVFGSSCRRDVNYTNGRIDMTARILIVEDEMLVAIDMEAILEERGYECAGIAPDLETAAEYFETSLDLALVDLNLRDGLTGPEIGKRLSSRGVPVIFVTANPAELGDGVAGTIGVITKPTDETTLADAVSYVLARKNGLPVRAPAALRLFG
jgi:DNA-binding response OmpR family regulator